MLIFEEIRRARRKIEASISTDMRYQAVKSYILDVVQDESTVRSELSGPQVDQEGGMYPVLGS